MKTLRHISTFSEDQVAENGIPRSSRENKSSSRNIFWHLQKQDSTPSQPQLQVTLTTSAAKSEAQAPNVVQFAPGIAGQSFDYKLKETSPTLGSGRIVGGRVIRFNNRPVSTYDLVEPMLFLFFLVVKARDLPNKDLSTLQEALIHMWRLKLGITKRTTKYYEKKKDPEWNEVFSFARDRLQASRLEIRVKR